MNLPSPQELGLPSKYKKWRQHQERAIRVIDEARTSTVALMLPPGAGKTGIYMAWAVWRKKRVMVLAPTKHLQDQIYADFKGLGLLNLKGQSDPSHHCEITGGTVQDGPCHGGYECPVKGTCSYFADLKRAPREQFVLANPAFWMHNKSLLGEFDALILDEAHRAFDAIAGHVSISFSKADVKNFFHQQPRRDWKPWASYQRSLLSDMLRSMKNKRTKSDETWEEIRVVKRLYDKLDKLADADPASLIYQESHRGWTWDCVWPGAYRSLLTSNAKKYVFTSGTMTPRTMAMLGYGKTDYTWAEFPSTFPVERCPVHILPSPSLNYETSISELRLWLEMMDSYIDKRVDRRGLIHTGSYDRAFLIAYGNKHKDAASFIAGSRHSSRMITHSNTAGLKEAMERFLETSGAILVSPSIIEGVDFPYDAARWQIIAKLPFSDPRDPVEAERKRQDPNYPWYTAALKVQQARGRVMRVEDDFGETAIADGAWEKWFYRSNAHHFTSYFRDAVRVLMVAPKTAPVTAPVAAEPPLKKISILPKKSLDARVKVGASSVPQSTLFHSAAPSQKTKQEK